MSKLSEDLINISTMLMVAKNRGEIIGLAGELNATVVKAMDIEKTGMNPDEKRMTASATIKFTKQEIDKMSKTFKKEFIANGCVAHIIKRPSGKKGAYYEIRYRRNGFNITVSNKDLKKAKELFIEATKQLDCNITKSTVPTTFHEFATYYFETFWKRKVTELTYANEMYRYKNYIKPAFESIQINKITPLHCQKFLDEIGISKTGDEIYSCLSKVFKSAIKHGIINHNPLDLVVHTKHVREHGKALTKAEEQLLLQSYAGNRYQLLFAVALYTGLRPNEYKTAIIEGDFIKAVNSKQKNGKTAYKKIPITPMLKPYLSGVTEFNFPGVEYMRDNMNTVLPKHKLYDLRTTFYTRCTECGIAEVAIKKFVGHSLGGLADTYTDLSDEFLLHEALKFKY